MKFKKLHLVFFLSLGTGMLLAMIFLIHVVISSLGEIRSLGAEELIAIRTRGTVQKISKEINRQIARSRAIASILARFKPQTHPWKEDSESISLMVRDFLGASPGLGGAFLYWISDSDNVDKSSRKSVASPGPAGLFAPYWTRGGDGGLFKSRLLENEFLCPDGRPGPWFGRARETGMAVITSPFRGRIGGSVVSLVVPLIYGGEFKGVLGLDLDLKFVQSMADRFAKGGDTLLLMNHKGVVLGLSGIPDMVGRDVEFGLDGTGAMHSLPGKLSIVHKGENRVEVTAPVKFDKAFSSWILKVVTSLSLEKDHMPIPWIKIIALAVLCVGLILVSTAVALTRWVSPFSRVSFHVQEMVKGDFTVRIPCDPGHDASNICEKLNMLGELLDKRAGILEEVARGNLSGKTEILSARDAMGMALDKLLSGLKSRVIHVDALAAGNFSRTPKVFGDRDRFGSSLTRITDSLRSSVVALENLGDEKSSVETKAGQENHSLNHAVKRVAERIRDERWAFVGRLELMQKMLGQRETIFPEVIAFLCRYLDVQTGNIFLYEQEACLLRRCGCFSPVEGSENIDTVSADHGYLGQVLKDKESIVVGEVDDSFRPLVFSSFQIPGCPDR